MHWPPNPERAHRQVHSRPAAPPPAQWTVAIQWTAAAGFGALAILAAGLLYAEVIAHQDSAASLHQALRVETGLARTPKADHLERLAELDADRSPEAQREALREAVRIDPRRSSAWTFLGLLAERNGDWSGAERNLLEAAGVDRQYLPAWTLANYYFRRGKHDAFWEWARRAALLTTDDLTPLLRLADRFEPDPLRLLERLGDSSRLERSYLTFLIVQGRLDRAQQVGLRLGALRDPTDSPRLTELASRQIAAGHAGAALQAWNMVHTPGLDPLQGPVLTNPDFRVRPSGDGFDWTLATACPGVETVWSAGQLQFSFSGGQPDDCVLLMQTLVLAPARRYRLRFEYRSQGAASARGIDWTLDPFESSASLPLRLSSAKGAARATKPDQELIAPRSVLHEFLSNRTPGFSPAIPNWIWEERRFSVPRRTNPGRAPQDGASAATAPGASTDVVLVRLRLMVHRQPGTLRYQGTVWLRQLQMESI